MRRSNRPLTQYACVLLDEFMLGKLKPGIYSNLNTKIEYTQDKASKTLQIFLFDYKIISVSLTLPDETPFHLEVGLTDTFTSDGQPTRTTIERLNGLLDCLGFHGVIPEGVRVFKDSIEGMFYLGKGDNKIAVGRKYAKNVLLNTDPYDFSVQSSDLRIA